MQRRIVSAVIVFGLLAGVLVSFGMAQEYTLKYNLARGTKFTLTNESSEETIQEVMGNEMVVNSNSSSVSKCVVLSADEEAGIKIEYEFADRKSESETPQGASSVDFSELIGKKVKFLLSGIGEASGFEGFDELPEITHESGQTIGKDRFINSIKNLFPKLPEKPVKIGESWTRTQEDDVPMPDGGALKSKTDFTYTLLEEVKKDGLDCLKIGISFTQTVSGEFEQMGMPIVMEMKGKGDDVMYFAHKKGMLVSYEDESSSEGMADVASAGMSIPITRMSKSTLNVTFE